MRGILKLNQILKWAMRPPMRGEKMVSHEKSKLLAADNIPISNDGADHCLPPVGRDGDVMFCCHKTPSQKSNFHHPSTLAGSGNFRSMDNLESNSSAEWLRNQRPTASSIIMFIMTGFGLDPSGW